VKLVSIIIPLYNCEIGIANTLQTVAQQTYTDIEVIVVDDGSTDQSCEIVMSFGMNNLRLFKQPNSGAAIARNTGLKYANGNFIQFLDAGDLLSPNKIEVQVNALSNHPGKVAVCNYKQFTTLLELNNEKYPNQSHFIYSTNDTQDFLVNLLGGRGDMNFIQTNSWLIPQTIISQSGNWRAYRCPDDDGEMFTRILLASDGIVYTSGVYNYYHIMPGGINQLSRNNNNKYLMNKLLTIDLKHKYLQKHGKHSFLDRAIAAQYYRFAVDVYPSNKILSSIAWRRFTLLNQTPPKIILGGRVIQFIYNIFGWRIARYIRFYFRRL
jgi:glycosyltransferase involved in cell wall biosynthesis